MQSLSRILPSLFIAAVISLTAASAFADHGTRYLDVELDELAARIDDGRLRVTYEIDRRDWKKLSKLHITPRLNLYAPQRRGAFTYVTSIPLTKRSATVYFSPASTPRHAPEIELRLSGERGRTKIARTSYRSTSGSRVRVALQNHDWRRSHDHGHARSWADSNAAIIKACDANTSWSGELEDCVKRAKKIDHGSVAAINACGEATDWFGPFNSCLEHAATLRGDKAATIKACGNASSWFGEFDDCLATVSRKRP